eukprot:9828466-Alexandrium_andersonii.AAC.1
MGKLHGSLALSAPLCISPRSGLRSRRFVLQAGSQLPLPGAGRGPVRSPVPPLGACLVLHPALGPVPRWPRW